jgi:hypothetical protein
MESPLRDILANPHPPKPASNLLWAKKTGGSENI